MSIWTATTPSRRSTRWRRWPLLAVLAVVAPLIGPAAQGAPSQAETPPPNTFGLRLEGFAVEKRTFSTATAVQPRSAYSYAKVSSFLDLDGGRGLDMEARGANDQYQGFEGAVIFAGGMPTNGNNLPGYTQAFFPTFEGFSQISEKCAFNQTEAKETPECREQDGPYALARVVPDQEFPSATGIGRNQGDGEEQGDARSSSVIEPQPDGSMMGHQSNSGSDQGVPGTPITVDSFLAEQTVRTSIGESSVDITCEGEVSVGGQQVSDNKQLQQALAPLSIGSDLRVEFEPPTEPVVEKLPGGALEASCRGPRFTVFNSAQGGSGTQYTYGKTFAAVGVTDNREAIGGGVDPSGGTIGAPPPSEPPPPSAPEPTSEPTSSPAPTPTQPPPAPEPSEPPPPVDEPLEETASSDLVRKPIDTMPVGLLTAAAAGLLPLAIWLMLGVTGSLAQGLPTLKLPPFRS